MEKKCQIKYDGRFLDKHGKATPLLKKDIKISLNCLESIVGCILKTKKGNPSSFGIRDIFVVGSVLKGSTESDIDLYMRTEGTDVATNDLLKLNSFYMLCEGKNKNDWIDLYFGTEIPNTTGYFKDKPKYCITDQVKEEMKKYNENIGAGNVEPGH